MSVTLWLITYLAHSSLIYLCLMIGRRRMSSLSAAETVWRSAMVVPVLTATVTRCIDAGFWTIDLRAMTDFRSGFVAPISAPFGWPGQSWAELVARVSVAIGILLFALELLGRWRFVRQLGPRTLVHGRLAAIFGDVQQQLGMRGPLRLTSSPVLTSPIALNRREICIPPRSAILLDDRELRALFAHELAHLRRRDEWWSWIAAAIQRTLFLQPFNRVARRTLQHLAEAACDDWAASRLRDPDAMASCLLEVAGWTERPHPPAILGIVGQSGVADRIARLLDRRAVTPDRSRRTRLLMSLVICCGVMPLSPGFLVARPVAADFLAGYEAGLRVAADPPDHDHYRSGLELARAFRASHPQRSRESLPADIDAKASQLIELERRLSRAKSSRPMDPQPGR